MVSEIISERRATSNRKAGPDHPGMPGDFPRNQHTAIALISSGQYVAGVIWPAAFERLIAGPGWRVTYLVYAGIILLGTLPLAALFLHNSSVGIATRAI